MDLARASWTPSPGGKPHAARLILALMFVIGLTLGVASLFGITPSKNAGQLAFGAILLMGLVHLLANAIDERPNAYVVLRIGGTAIAVAVFYFALQAATQRLVSGSLPSGRPLDGTLDYLIAVMVVLSFAAVTVFQNQIARHSGHAFWEAAYVHLKQGLYINTLANRLVLKFWPRRRAASIGT